MTASLHQAHLPKTNSESLPKANSESVLSVPGQLTKDLVNYFFFPLPEVPFY